eukprot:481792-Rhodomonas_salina.2
MHRRTEACLSGAGALAGGAAVHGAGSRGRAPQGSRGSAARCPRRDAAPNPSRPPAARQRGPAPKFFSFFLFCALPCPSMPLRPRLR